MNGLASNLGLIENQGNTVVFEAKDMSFQIPLRKKLNLEITLVVAQLRESLTAQEG